MFFTFAYMFREENLSSDKDRNRIQKFERMYV